MAAYLGGDAGAAVSAQSLLSIKLVVTQLQYDRGLTDVSATPDREDIHRLVSVHLTDIPSHELSCAARWCTQGVIRGAASDDCSPACPVLADRSQVAKGRRGPSTRYHSLPPRPMVSRFFVDVRSRHQSELPMIVTYGWPSGRFRAWRAVTRTSTTLEAKIASQLVDLLPRYIWPDDCLPPWLAWNEKGPLMELHQMRYFLALARSLISRAPANNAT